jgi:hypothetical protein
MRPVSLRSDRSQDKVCSLLLLTPPPMHTHPPLPCPATLRRACIVQSLGSKLAVKSWCNSLFQLAALVLVCVLSPGSLLAQAQSTGIIEGRVLNVGNGRYLSNAKVTVEGTKLTAFTNDYGNFVLSGVPAGEVRLKASYTGLDDELVSVTVQAGKSVKFDFELTNTERYGKEKVLQLDTFVVESQKEYEGDALSTNEQRYSGNGRLCRRRRPHGLGPRFRLAVHQCLLGRHAHDEFRFGLVGPHLRV